MRPTPIADGQILEGHDRLVMGPPRGHDVTGDTRAVEMCCQRDPEYGQVFRARYVLEDGDLERLAAGEPIWVSFFGMVVPFAVDLAEPG